MLALGLVLWIAADEDSEVSEDSEVWSDGWLLGMEERELGDEPDCWKLGTGVWVWEVGVVGMRVGLGVTKSPDITSKAALLLETAEPIRKEFPSEF